MGQGGDTVAGRRIAFAVMAVEAGALRAHVTPEEMYRRLRRVGLMESLIIGCYDVMHTLSISQVADDVVTALENWEKKGR